MARDGTHTALPCAGGPHVAVPAPSQRDTVNVDRTGGHNAHHAAGLARDEEVEPDQYGGHARVGVQLRLIDDTLHVSSKPHRQPDPPLVPPVQRYDGSSPARSSTVQSKSRESNDDRQGHGKTELDYYPRRGFAATLTEAFGCVPHPNKARAFDSIDTSTDGIGDGGSDGRTGLSVGTCRDGAGRTYFPWCGWLIDVNTCELRPHMHRAKLVAARERRTSRHTTLASIPQRARGALATTPSDGSAPAAPRPNSLAALSATLYRAARPKLHAAFMDPQVCSMQRGGSERARSGIFPTLNTPSLLAPYRVSAHEREGRRAPTTCKHHYCMPPHICIARCLVPDQFRVGRASQCLLRYPTCTSHRAYRCTRGRADASQLGAHLRCVLPIGWQLGAKSAKASHAHDATGTGVLDIACRVRN